MMLMVTTGNLSVAALMMVSETLGELNIVLGTDGESDTLGDISVVEFIIVSQSVSQLMKVSETQRQRLHPTGTDDDK